MSNGIDFVCGLSRPCLHSLTKVFARIIDHRFVAGMSATFLVCLSAHAAVYDSRFIEVGGIDQWIQIRGVDEQNPILLWLNGGPGSSTIPDSFAYEPWEEYFTVVMWDQRGEGKTFEKHGRAFADTMTIERMSEDGIEVAEYLKTRFSDSGIVLLGHSWGTILGTHMIKRRPDLFAAYVGTGQVVSIREQLEAAYPQLLERAAELGNVDAERELQEAGPPTSSDPEAYDLTNIWGARLDPPPLLPVRPFTFPPSNDRPAYLAEGTAFSHEVLGDIIVEEDLTMLGNEFETSVIFFQGEFDLITTSSVVRNYYDTIEAPTKQYVTLPDAGHNAIFRARDAFLDALLAEVLPLLQRGSSAID
jgi:pimeloyl-ACP methyl ester carboxylesterase